MDDLILLRRNRLFALSSLEFKSFAKFSPIVEKNSFNFSRIVF